MASDGRLLRTLKAINEISRKGRLGFDQKLERILIEIIQCMHANSGSIMLVKGRRNLEVVASTRPELIGVKQPLEEVVPSSWVVKNRSPLRVDDIGECKIFHKKFDNYKGAAFLLAPVMADDRVIGVLSVTDKTGKGLFSREEQSALLDIAGHVIGAVETQRLTESLKKKRRELQQKNLELRKLEKLRTDLFNMLIHDLKGPISEIVANLDILSYALKGENLNFVRLTQTACDTLYRMVSNLLDIARLEENRLQLVWEKMEPGEILGESVARVDALAATKGLKILERLPPQDRCGVIRGDRDILLRVLQNLLGNAIHYSPAGETIEVGFLGMETPEIEFFVKDNGPGIPPKFHDAIFDKFLQLEKKSDGRIYTTGLGLTFCKMAVEAHGGKIRVNSDGTRGSRFSFTLPR